MKKTDIAMVILIATISVMIAFFVTQSVIGSPSGETVKVKTVEKMSANVTEPDPAIFNENAINPAVKIEINDDTSQ